VSGVGRPSDYTPEIARAICDRLALDESLASICRDERMPSTTTVYRWRNAHLEFRDDYARAREDQGHTVADTIGDIRRAVMAGEIAPDVARVAGDLAKWEASRRAGRDFGDKQLIGSDPDNPLPQGFNVRLVGKRERPDD
jgi:hypothetical protein